MMYTVDRENKTITIVSDNNPLEEIVEVAKMYSGYTLTKSI